MIAENWEDVRKDILALTGNIRVLSTGDFGPVPPDVIRAWKALQEQFRRALRAD